MSTLKNTKSKKVISFSLWGDNPTYSVGAIENAKLANIYFPDFECWFYVHKDTVHPQIISDLSELDNVKIIFKTENPEDLNVKPLMWRFEAIDDPGVEIMLSRDTDTRFLKREILAVQEWLESGKTFHIMRDHPHHTVKILAGMFGTRKINGFSWTEAINVFPREGFRDYDQNFLAEAVYPIIINDVIIHSSFHRYEGELSKPFPIPFSAKHEFVGEYIFSDGSRSISHVFNILQESDIMTLPNNLEPRFANEPLISVVIGTYQRIKLLPLTISTVREELKNIPHEIIVVDGGSTDGTIEWLTQQKDIIAIIQHNRGEWNGAPIKKRSWGYFMNLGFKAAQGKYVCMLSDDCIVIPKSILNGLSLFEKSLNAEISVGGIAFYWRNWPTQNEYVVGQTWGNRMHINHGLYLNDALKKVGYIDENNYSFYHADSDLSLKLWNQGFYIIDSPHSFIEHYIDPLEEVRSLNLTSQPKDWETYTNKWEPIFGNAPTQDWLTCNYFDTSNSAKKFEDALKDNSARAGNFIKMLKNVLIKLWS